MPGDARVCVAVDVGLPLPARRVRVSGADELGLEPLEFLLVAEFIGLLMRVVSICGMVSGRDNVPFCYNVGGV